MEMENQMFSTLQMKEMIKFVKMGTRRIPPWTIPTRPIILILILTPTRGGGDCPGGDCPDTVKMNFEMINNIPSIFQNRFILNKKHK